MSILQFGKFKGQEIQDVELSYLKWLEENATNMAPSVRNEILQEINIRTTDESSIGRDIEGPSYVSYEEMLYQAIIKWLVQENTITRIRLPLDRTLMETSLINMLKAEVPKIKKQYKNQRRS
jgi:hypothetical protein